MKKLYFLLLLFLTINVTYSQVINEVDADTPGTDTAEFVEIFWTPNTPLDNLSVVFFNGNGDASYQVFDLDGFSTDANGFFILGNSGIITTGDIDIGTSNVLQNGADAVALYSGDFTQGDAITATNFLNGVVYDTNDGDDSELLAVIGGVQYNEDENSAKDAQSVQRNTDGTYTVKNTTFRADNGAAVCDLSLGSTSATCDNFTVGTDTYTATLDFNGGATSTYNVTASSGTVDLSAGDPSTDTSGTITVTGVAEGTDVTITIQDGGLCNESSMISSPVCEPSLNLPLYEGFDYTVAEDLNNQNNWTGFNGGSSIAIGGPGGLTYTGLANDSQTGNHIAFQGSGQESKIEFTPVTSGTVYASFIFQITDLSAITDLNDGGYFAALANSDSSYDLRFWVHPDTDPVASSFDIAITATTFNPTFAGSYNTNQSVFIVMSYTPGTGEIKGWVNPTSLGGTEPAADFSETDGDIENSIDRFVLRQDSAGETPAILFDELRIGTTWADVTPQVLSNDEFNLDTVSIYPNPTTSGVVNITSTNTTKMNVQLFDVLGKQVKNETLTNNSLNVSELKSGIYIVRITQNNAVITKKLIIK